MTAAFFSFFVVFLCTFAPVSAQDASDSGEMLAIGKKTDDATAEKSNQILQNLENLVKDTGTSNIIRTQYDDVTTHARGFIGQVTALKEDSFKVVTPDDEEMLIAPDKSTTLVKKGDTTTGEGLTLADWISINDWLVIIGIQNGDNFQPRRIMISSDSLEPSVTFVRRGLVKTATTSKLDVSILGEQTTETFALTKTTNLVDADNETITTKDLPAETPVLLIGTMKADKKALQTLRKLDSPATESSGEARL
ncbi:hypothetical protein IJJ12_00750 [bacterium]|nr:hypothetical protein [bacterium]